MNNLRSVLGAVALTAVVTQPAFAGEPAPAEATLAAAFGGSTAAVEVLDYEQMAQTEGKLAPLLLPLTIVGVDLALIGAFWGVYIPYISGDCSYCVIP